MAASIQVPTIFSAKDNFTQTVANMSRSVKNFSRRGIADIKRFDTRVTNTFRKMSGLARMAVGAGLGMAVVGAVNVVKDYEQSLADLSAVMNTTKENEMLLAKDAERLGASTAKSATEVVGLQEAFARLGFPTSDIINMTEATINGSIAMNAELTATAELTGAMIKTFDKFSSIDAPDILDKMTLSTQRSALSFEKLQIGLPIVSGAANSAGIPFERLLALMGKLSDAGIDASSSSTALRNIFLDSAKKGLSYEQILGEIVKQTDKLTPAMDEFGKRGAVSAAILSNKLSETDKLTKVLSNDFKGVANEAARKRLDTFGGSLTLLQSAWEGLLIKTDENSGAMSILRSTVDFVTKNIETLALIVVSIIGLFILMKAVVLGAQIATFAYNIAMGISAARTGAMSLAMKGNIVAQTAFKIAMFLSTAATWVANSAFITLAASVLAATWPILAIIAAVLAVVYIFLYWDEIVTWFSQKWEQFTNFISEAWQGVISWFQEFSFEDMFRSIGQSIIDFMLTPLKSMLWLISKMPGKLGDLGKSALAMVNDVSGEILVNEGNKEVMPSSSQASNENVSRSISEKNSNVKLEIEAKNSKINNVENNDNIPIYLGSTLGFS